MGYRVISNRIYILLLRYNILCKSSSFSFPPSLQQQWHCGTSLQKIVLSRNRLSGWQKHFGMVCCRHFCRLRSQHHQVQSSEWNLMRRFILLSLMLLQMRSSWLLFLKNWQNSSCCGCCCERIHTSMRNLMVLCMLSASVWALLVLRM